MLFSKFCKTGLLASWGDVAFGAAHGLLSVEEVAQIRLRRRQGFDDRPHASKKYKNEHGPDSVPDGYDVDYVIDLQLGGVDHVSNVRPLDASVNRSMGAQIRYLIKDLPEGTKIGNGTFE